MAVETARKRLGQILVDAGFVDAGALEEALKRQQVSRQPLGQILQAEGLISRDDVAAALSLQFDTPLIDLGLEETQEAALRLVPESFAREHHLLPLRIQGAMVVVAMAFPDDKRTILELQKRTNLGIRPFLAPREDIDQLITQRYRVIGDVVTAVERYEVEHKPSPQFVAPLLVGVDENAPVVQIVNLIFTQALRDRASDVHVEPQERDVSIRFRIDGTLHEATRLPKDVGPAIVSRLKVMANLNIVEKRRSQDGQIQLTMDGREADVRVSTIETIWGEKAVMRMLDKSRALINVEELGMESGVLERYQELLKAPFGMVLVVGPTGSGKTTTLYASVNELDRVSRNIMTIEDPVEYIIEGTSQVPINPTAGRTFASGLRSLLRQDPDVILVGEIRDQETVEIAMNSALTGHLVLSSLHSIDTVGSVFRLVDLGVPRFMITSSTVAIIAQRLVRRLCERCKVERRPQIVEAALLRQAKLSADTVFGPGGCNYCSNTGYLGRVGVFELLIFGDEIRAAVNEGGSAQELRTKALRAGLVTLRDAALQKVVEGLTSPADVLAILQGAG
ncbi:MAG: Flp pilus assembly complex ATPase component TadA [Chloroflexi bacterium]|nr:Flp pilus assembly complex ATPase component TadA [Chloroflexota bacterium]